MNAFNNELPESNNPEHNQFVSLTPKLSRYNFTEVNSYLQNDIFFNILLILKEATISYSQNNLPIINYSHGILSWSKVNAECKLFRVSCSLSKARPFICYYGTDNYENIFSFKYAASAFSLLTSSVSVSKEMFILKFISILPAIFLTLASLDPYSKPYYHIFENKKIYAERMQESRRIPLYFLFASISYLIKTDDSNKEIFKPLIEDSYKRITAANLFKSEKWNF